MMDKRLIATLLRVANAAEHEFSVSAGLRQFHHDYGLGRLRGQTRITFTAMEKDEIRALLRAGEGIEAEGASADDWKGLTRAAALDRGRNEKLAGGAVKRNRISVKHLPGRALLLNGESLRLFPGAHVNLDWRKLGAIGHNCVLLVENYECFDALDEIVLANVLPRDYDPLVLYRGDQVESRLDSVMAFLAESALPVILFGDWDPASLVEAARFPGAVGMLCPGALGDLLHARGNMELYRRQVNAAFDRLADDPRHAIRHLHGVIHHARSGLVQEILIGRSTDLRFVPFETVEPPPASADDLPKTID